jgi:hypothetical protein
MSYETPGDAMTDCAVTGHFFEPGNESCSRCLFTITDLTGVIRGPHRIENNCHLVVTAANPSRWFTAEIDCGIVEDVLKLWSYGIRTVFSCEDLGSSVLSKTLGHQVVLESSKRFRDALEILPWAAHAEINTFGYVSITERTCPEDPAGNWLEIWRRS